ncbi:MAG: VCBS repeat-containing protein [Chitinophagales bacterium]|nr:VCBS repeat-containing protein [Chitinophagales bacterium]HQU76701.1 VCBS repeat-containing protein [Chitinophagales bacterium]
MLRIRPFYKLFFFLLVLIPAILSRAQYQPPQFNLTDAGLTGISFSNDLQEDEERNVLQYQYFYNGGGVCAGDVNNDGLCDLFFTGNDVSNRLYINQGNWYFQDVTAKAGLTSAGWSTGAVMADVNDDGWLDIYVCRSGKYDAENRKNLLFINQRNNTFKEEAARYGLDDPAQSTMAAFFDYDRDGDLDMFLLNHSVTQYSNFNVAELRSKRDPMAGNKLYRNDKGHFTDVSDAAGIYGNPINFGLGVAISDFNNDGWPDIYCTSDYQEQDYLYYNNGDGTFTQVMQYAMAHTSLFSMGTDWGDINNDGLSDLIVADMLPASNKRQKMLKGPLKFDAYQLAVDYGFHHQLMRNTLQLNRANGTFSDIGMMAGVAATDWSWAPLLADLDNDGWQDLFVTNGYLRDFTNMDFLKYTYNEELDKASSRGEEVDMLHLVHQMPSVKLPNAVYHNNHDLTFSNKTRSWDMNQPGFSNGAVYADLDNDGDLDLVVNNLNDTAFVYRNNGGGGYLTFTFDGPAGNRFGVGTKVTITGKDLYIVRENFPTRGYQSAVESKLYAGLGSSYLVDVQIDWPDGKRQVLKQVKANSTLTCKWKDADDNVPSIARTFGQPLMEESATPVLPATYINNEFIDLKREPLLTFGLSDTGPRMAIADVNGDGKEDVFFCAAKGQQSQLYIQQNGQLVLSSDQPFNTANPQDMSDAALFDADGDGDNDLFVTFGGNEAELSTGYVPQLLLNDGQGNFIPAKNAFPEIHISASCVRPTDIDLDGDQDVFIGAACLPGRYPQSGSSYILRNEGGRFTDVTDQYSPLLRQAGMVTDARWADLNGDKLPDLLFTGYWMPVRIFLQGEEGMEEQVDFEGMSGASGWFSCLIPGDVDGDGDLDFLAGNNGLNSPFKASSTKPLYLYAKDFDNNGTIDPIIAGYKGDTCYPLVSRDDLLDQVNGLKKRFVRYAQYANATVQDIFPNEDWSSVWRLEATNLSTCLFINDGDGQFHTDSLPYEAQMFPVRCATFADVNGDGKTDLILAGNRFNVRPDVGRMDAGQGLLLLQTPGGWSAAENTESGLYLPEEMTDMKWLTLNLERYLLVSGIHQQVRSYHIRKNVK